MAQQHVGHLNYRRHMNAAANEQLTKRAWSRESQNSMYAMLPCQGVRHDIFSACGLGPHAGTVAHIVHEGSA